MDGSRTVKFQLLYVLIIENENLMHIQTGNTYFCGVENT